MASMTGINGRRFSVGFRRKVGSIVALCIASLVLVPGAGLTGSMLTMTISWLVDRDIPAKTQANLGGIGALVAAAGMMTLVGLSIARRVRAGAWLDGTRLCVRRVRTRSVELMAATSVSINARSEAIPAASAGGQRLVAVRTPVLTVTGPGGPIELRLRRPDGPLLPADELLALAAALSESRCPGAPEAVAWLRAIASDPRSLFA